MITRRKPPANNSPRFFALRLTKDDEATLDDARRRMASDLGGPPSNPLFFGELLRFYLERTDSAPSNTIITNEGVSALDI